MQTSTVRCFDLAKENTLYLIVWLKGLVGDGPLERDRVVFDGHQLVTFQNDGDLLGLALLDGHDDDAGNVQELGVDAVVPADHVDFVAQVQLR